MASPSSNADEREGRLLATMLNVLVAGMSDPSRLGRGRTYARQGAVEDLDVHPGIVTGAVQGSRAQPYVVSVRVSPATRFDTLTALVPDRDEVDFSCSCPDWDDPCKHAVAVMVAFATFVAEEPAALGLWRGRGATATAERAVVGSRGRPADATAATPAAPPAIDPEAVAALRAYLGTNDEPVEFEVGPVSTLGPPNAAWGELWADMLADALDELTER